MEEEMDKVASDVVKDDQPEDKQSEETKEEPLTLEKVSELAKGLQKGYTLTRQEISEMKDNLSAIVEAVNKQTGSVSGDDEYVTTGKLKEILNQQTYEAEERKTRADSYIDNALTQLKTEGKISGKEDEDALLNFALKIKEPDLFKAATLFEEIKEAKDEARKEAVKTKVKQEEGSKIGTSSKSGTGEQGGVDYQKMKRMDWFSF
jgi:hypothetical protein